MADPDPAFRPAKRHARRRAVAWGLLSVAAYAALAGWSGRLSPLARRPLLDGIAPGAPYRWVDPPADLAPTNVPPSAGDFRIRLGVGGSFPDVLITNDNQVTIVPQKGSVAPEPDQTVPTLIALGVALLLVGGATFFGLRRYRRRAPA